ncbi:stage VI sporulation protein F [Paenibacillus chitinolyticus]|uniref:Stage VI sporulation protein F n=1 Tax=Paenibacillus chitinolyticus TaxID=79263 RepID=A0A410WV06_9BACL|nr:stage VI sporulation protein F [Paenibacillus chitinolyticus]MCY9589384.1 stage VI sporulation protein F [Paenibacillus chitinolyticus]MCY9594457.1 stage VI sporulation protein F [Paenibacillus chitinolyticus]QAV18296.1 hypothetical protein PC41400_11705 [Paenibacillus chitinolyticus]GKS11836.1 hypothetical protein YDYSY3_28360 [Paenibacillus chitinolyticus]
MPRNPKDILNTVKKKTGKSVTEKDIQKLASGVKPSTVQDEAQLRQLIKQVSQLVGIDVAEETVKEIVHAVKSSKLDGGNLQQMMNLIMKR